MRPYASFGVRHAGAQAPASTDQFPSATSITRLDHRSYRYWGEAQHRARILRRLSRPIWQKCLCLTAYFRRTTTCGSPVSAGSRRAATLQVSGLSPQPRLLLRALRLKRTLESVPRIMGDGVITATKGQGDVCRDRPGVFIPLTTPTLRSYTRGLNPQRRSL